MLYPIQLRAIKVDIGLVRPYWCWLTRMQIRDDDAENRGVGTRSVNCLSFILDVDTLMSL